MGEVVGLRRVGDRGIRRGLAVTRVAPLEGPEVRVTTSRRARARAGRAVAVVEAVAVAEAGAAVAAVAVMAAGMEAGAAADSFRPCNATRPPQATIR